MASMDTTMDANIDTYIDDDIKVKENEANEKEKEW
jgi:hypothetical protein